MDKMNMRGMMMGSMHQCMSNLVGASYIVLAVLIFVWRGGHTGYVCSGWYLSEGEKMNAGARSVYDIDTGLFLYVLMIINIVLLSCFALCCCGMMMMGTRMMRMRNKPDNEFDMNMTAD